jgi:hypothetical protein
MLGRLAMVLVLTTGCSSSSSSGLHPADAASDDSGDEAGLGTRSDASEAASCLPVGADCTSGATPSCCSGICTLQATTADQAACTVPCAMNSDCNSVCCAALGGNGEQVCSAMPFCLPQ